MLRNRRSALTASSSRPSIEAFTLTIDSRPWWHCMQRASAPRPVISAPEGMTTLSMAAVAALWQVVQVITVPGAASASTVPAGVPSAPM